MEVLRTAFQTSLVLEWGGAVAVALVAVEISLRLMAGAIEFERALAVLIIVPEFFLPAPPARRRATTAGAAGRAVAERVFAILDEPVPATPAGAAVGAATVRPSPVRPRRHRVRRRRPSPIRAGRRRPSTDSTWSIPARGRGRPRRRDRRRQVDHRQPPASVHRARRGLDPASARSRSRSIDLAAWRAHVAWVPQRPHLFHGTSPTTSGWPGRRRTATRLCATPLGKPAPTPFIAAPAARVRRRRSARTGSGSAAASASASPSPARSSPTLGWSSSTRRPRISMRRARPSSATRSSGLARDRAVLVVSHRLRLACRSPTSSRSSIVGGSSRSGAPAELRRARRPLSRGLLAARPMRGPRHDHVAAAASG